LIIYIYIYIYTFPRFVQCSPARLDENEAALLDPEYIEDGVWFTKDVPVDKIEDVAYGCPTHVIVVPPGPPRFKFRTSVAQIGSIVLAHATKGYNFRVATLSHKWAQQNCIAISTPEVLAHQPVWPDGGVSLAIDPLEQLVRIDLHVDFDLGPGGVVFRYPSI
jgi:hypothetical protein